MNERHIEISEVNPSEIFGVHNQNLEIIKKYFPKLKIVARGARIKAYGEKDILDVFEKKMEMLVAYYVRYNSLNEHAIEQLLLADSEISEQESLHKDLILHGVNGRQIKVRTKHQKEMFQALQKHDMLFAVGPAGTGKTYTAVAMAVKALKEKQVRRIILTRPAVEAGENLGFLPGDLREKLDPYMQPLYDALQDMIPYEKLQSYIEKRIIQIAPLAFMRGRT